MAAELLAKSIDNEILKNCISHDNYEQWQKQYTWDALTNQRYGESFCNYFKIKDHRIFHETNWLVCDTVIRREWLATSWLPTRRTNNLGSPLRHNHCLGRDCHLGHRVLWLAGRSLCHWHQHQRDGLVVPWSTWSNLVCVAQWSGSMHRIRIEHVGPIEAIELKNQLLKDGLSINQDFVWEYRQATYDNDGFTPVDSKQAIFSFFEPAMATFYQLKWSR